MPVDKVCEMNEKNLGELVALKREIEKVKFHKGKLEREAKGLEGEVEVSRKVTKLRVRLKETSFEGEGGGRAVKLRLALEIGAAVRDLLDGYEVVWGDKDGGGDGASIFVEGRREGSVVGVNERVREEVANMVAMKLWEFEKITELEGR